MTTYLVRRLLLLPLVLLGVLTLTFLLIQLIPGDPAVYIAGADAPPQVVERIRAQYALDRPVWEQYMIYVGGAIRGDFGRSLVSRARVSVDVVRTLPNTLTLVAFAWTWAMLSAIGLGTFAAVNRGKLVDRAATVVAITGLSVPIFFTGLALMWLFAYKWGWLPLLGMHRPVLTWKGLSHIVLPAFTLGVTYMATLTRLTRSAMLEVLRQDYIITARSKGIHERVIIFKHALKNAMLPVVTVMGAQLVHMFGGAVVCETIFAWPGMGRLSVTAVLANDFPVIQGVVVVTGLASVVLNLAVDLFYAILDPRIRYS